MIGHTNRIERLKKEHVAKLKMLLWSLLGGVDQRHRNRSQSSTWLFVVGLYRSLLVLSQCRSCIGKGFQGGNKHVFMANGPEH